MMQLLVVVFSLQAVALVTSQGPVQCPTTSPCVCTEGVIDCSNKNLNSIPVFITPVFRFNSLFLGQNNISQVNSNAFANLNVSEIYLDQNVISDIPNDAFTGIENVITVLSLRDNQLTRIPAAVGRLTNLHNLNVQENAIGESGFVDSVLTDIGDTLVELHLGDLTYFSDWPHSLHHLQSLEKLDVFGGQFPILPPEGFQGFENTLKTLIIRNGSLITLPLGISRLQNLQELHIDSNHDIGDHGFMLEALARASNTLKILTLIDNRLTQLPRMLPQLRSLTTLNMANNPLDFISDETVDSVPLNLTSLTLQSCSLQRIPAALDSLIPLTTIDLSDNNIVTFERYDLNSLVNLRVLSLSDNPLSYISTEAFTNLVSLESLNIANTNLLVIPRAVGNLRSLVYLDVTHPPFGVECTCDMLWMTELSKRPLFRIIGKCDTVSSTVSEYLTGLQGLVTCPGYVST